MQSVRVPDNTATAVQRLWIKPAQVGDWDMQVYGPNGGLLDGSGNSHGQVEFIALLNPVAGCAD